MGYLRPRVSRDRSDFLFAGAHYRAHLGETYLGSLVGLGCALDFDAHPLVDLRRLSHASVANRAGFHAGSIRRGSRDCWVSRYSLQSLCNVMVAGVPSPAQDHHFRRNRQRARHLHDDDPFDFPLGVHFVVFCFDGAKSPAGKVERRN